MRFHRKRLCLLILLRQRRLSISVAPATPIFMLNKSFGIHETWVHRWAYRLFAHRASFQGEAQIAHAAEPDMTLPCFRVNLESAWVRFQLWTRAAEAGKQVVLAALLLQLPLEELFVLSC